MQVLLEHLPHEVFVDPFEVAEAGIFGGNISDLAGIFRKKMQVLLEHLPHEVFVDPFEVAEAGRFGGNISHVVSSHAVDLEVCVWGGDYVVIILSYTNIMLYIIC
jgi:hypothetical protein